MRTVLVSLLLSLALLPACAKSSMEEQLLLNQIDGWEWLYTDPRVEKSLSFPVSTDFYEVRGHENYRVVGGMVYSAAGGKLARVSHLLPTDQKYTFAHGLSYDSKQYLDKLHGVEYIDYEREALKKALFGKFAETPFPFSVVAIPLCGTGWQRWHGWHPLSIEPTDNLLRRFTIEEKSEQSLTLQVCPLDSALSILAATLDQPKKFGDGTFLMCPVERVELPKPKKRRRAVNIPIIGSFLNQEEPPKERVDPTVPPNYIMAGTDEAYRVSKSEEVVAQMQEWCDKVNMSPTGLLYFSVNEVDTIKSMYTYEIPALYCTATWSVKADSDQGRRLWAAEWLCQNSKYEASNVFGEVCSQAIDHASQLLYRVGETFGYSFSAELRQAVEEQLGLRESAVAKYARSHPSEMKALYANATRKFSRSLSFLSPYVAAKYVEGVLHSRGIGPSLEAVSLAERYIKELHNRLSPIFCADAVVDIVRTSDVSFVVKFQSENRLYSVNARFEQGKTPYSSRCVARVVTK